MAKKKDYMRMFVNYCRKNKIWFGVVTSGDIDYVTYCITGTDFYPDQATYKFGSKAAYDWLVSAHKKARDNA